ncbi:MAG: hypothetical protein R3182_04925, partial [Draconibacterium sp.]|nr:hypothetical protein [Draconibacterium sp.]
MKLRISIIIILVGFILIFQACSKKAPEGIIIFTQVSKSENRSLNSNLPAAYIAESQIMAINPNKKGTQAKLLSKDFYSACAPEISFDGKSMLFAAQKNKGDSWQVWEMDLNNLKVEKITSFEEDCISPAWLPGQRFVYTKLTDVGTDEKVFALYAANLDGTNTSQITFSPISYYSPTVLKDGRIIATSQQVYPEIGDKNIVVMRPDGTKQEIFYQNKNVTAFSKIVETQDERIVFVKETEENSSIISLDYNQPYFNQENLSANLNGSFNSVTCNNDNGLLVLHRSSNSDKYALCEYSMDNNLVSPIFKNDKADILEAAFVKVQERPKNLPSEVNMGVKTGLLVYQDINFYGIESNANHEIPIAERVE